MRRRFKRIPKSLALFWNGWKSKWKRLASVFTCLADWKSFLFNWIQQYWMSTRYNSHSSITQIHQQFSHHSLNTPTSHARERTLPFLAIIWRPIRPRKMNMMCICFTSSAKCCDVHVCVCVRVTHRSNLFPFHFWIFAFMNFTSEIRHSAKSQLPKANALYLHSEDGADTTFCDMMWDFNLQRCSCKWQRKSGIIWWYIFKRESGMSFWLVYELRTPVRKL